MARHRSVHRLGATSGSHVDIRVWQVDLRQPEAAVAELERLLAPDEREIAARGQPGVRRRRLVSRATLRIALGSVLGRPPESLEFVLSPRGKPELAGEEIAFSVSTSGDLGVVALARQGPLGVDVEQVAERSGLDRIVATRFAPVEAEAIERLGGEARLHAFYNCWTRKEAYLKATGAGLVRALDRVVVSVDDERPAIVSLDGDDPARWSLAALELAPGTVGAVAVRDGHGGLPARVPVEPLRLNVT